MNHAGSLIWKRLKKSCLSLYPYVILVIVTLCILWDQICNKSFILSGDSLFHVNQFYESAMQIKTGQFNWFLSLFGFGQAGRMVNAIYGPVFSYLVGALLLFTGTWVKAQIVLEFVIIFLSGIFMYHLLRFANVHRVISLMIGIIYACSYPISSFLQMQTFDGIGNIFMPLVIMVGLKMWKGRQIPVIFLAVLFAIIMQIHILTVIVSTLALIPFAVVSLVLSSRKWRWLDQFGESALLFLLLTSNIWALILNVFHSNYIIEPFPNKNPNVSTLSFSNGQLTYLGNLFIFIAIFLIILLVIDWRHLNWSYLFIPSLVVIYTFVPSICFPWNYINQIFPSIGQLFQFPFRLLGIPVTLILLSLGQNLEQIVKNANSSVIKKIIITLGLVGLFVITFASVGNDKQIMNGQIDRWNSGHFFRENYHLPVSNDKLKNAFSSEHNFGLASRYLVKAPPDYLPCNQSLSPRDYFKISPYTLTMREIYRVQPINLSKSHALPSFNRSKRSTALIEPDSALPYFHKFIQNHQLVMSWHQPKVLNNKYTILPVVKYHNTQMEMDYHPLHQFKLTKVGAIDIKPSAGFHQVTVNYHPTRFVMMMMILAAVSWLILIASGIFRAISNSI